jgi:spore coat polysaccharide biosynthesis protein SpsF
MGDHHTGYRTIAIVQARMGATRLPDKVLEDIGGEPMLAWVVERARRATLVHQVVVATSTETEDDPIEAFCKSKGYSCYRGSLHDVLDRYYQAARTYAAEVVVRLTADCPVIDPWVIDQTLQAFFGRTEALIVNGRGKAIPEELRKTQISWDFAANRLPPPWKRTFPIGLDTEVCTFNALEAAWNFADRVHQREHVMPYLYEHPERFHLLVVNHEPDYGHYRWTVDTREDLDLVRRIYNLLGDRMDFSWLDVLQLFEKYPELAEINAVVLPKNVMDVDDRAVDFD